MGGEEGLFGRFQDCRIKMSSKLSEMVIVKSRRDNDRPFVDVFSFSISNFIFGCRSDHSLCGGIRRLCFY